MKEESVHVMVRVRPLNAKEISENDRHCIAVDSENAITINDLSNGSGTRSFTFDMVFTDSFTQKTIYDHSAFPIVEWLFEGFNCTIFAYGQTGCGKTHTMMGSADSTEHMGIIPRTFSHCRSIICEDKNKRFLLKASYLEIYNECVFDLLTNDKKKLELKEDAKKGVYVKDLSVENVSTLEDMRKIMERGNSARTVGATAMNQDSSRSHSIFTLYVEASEEVDNKTRYTSSKLSLVDLAGSERSSKTNAKGDRLKEGTMINLSLSALGNVIQALVDGKSKYIPYRDSKLTRLLQDSLGGNTKTLMIAAVSPAYSNFEETMSTLRYANRAKNIKNKPRVNMDEKDLAIKQYIEEIEDLKVI